MSEEATSTTTNTEVPQEPSTILGGGGEPQGTESNLAFNPDSLPGELANEPSLRNFDSIEKLAKSYVHAVRKLGAPGEELVRVNGEADKDEIYNRLGRPEDPGGYEFDGEVPDHFREASHKIGLNKDQARDLLGYISDQNKQHSESMRDNYEKEQVNYQQSLQKEFGDDYGKNVELARRAFLQYGDAETVKFLDESGLGNHPGLIKTFSRIGKSLSEDNALLSGAGENLGGMTPVSAQSRLSELRADAEFMKEYNDAYHPKHGEAVKRMSDLYEYMH